MYSAAGAPNGWRLVTAVLIEMVVAFRLREETDDLMKSSRCCSRWHMNYKESNKVYSGAILRLTETLSM